MLSGDNYYRKRESRVKGIKNGERIQSTGCNLSIDQDGSSLRR